MNWELQLAAALGAGDEYLLSAAREVRERQDAGRYGPALAILWELLLKVRRTGSKKDLAFVYVHMGKVYQNWMAHVAFRYFRDALELAGTAGEPHVELVACHAIAGLYRAWNEPGKALPNFERCLALARESSGLWCRRDVLADLIACLEVLGETHRCEELSRRLARVEADLMQSLWGEPDGPLSDRVPPRGGGTSSVEPGRRHLAEGGNR